MAKKKTASASAPASAGAGATKENTAPAVQNEEKKSPPRFYAFKYVVQCDSREQMLVHDWLSSDDHFRTVWIKHDKDRYTQADIDSNPKQWVNGVRTRENPDGTKSEFHIGDLKPAHIHGYVRVQTKVTESTMSKRFGCYVHFDGVNDSYATLIYFTHSDFVSMVIDKKYQYQESDLRGDLDMYRDNCKKIKISDNFGVMIATYQEYVRKYGTKQNAVSALLRDGRLDVLTDIRKNSAFYDRFLYDSRASVCLGQTDIDSYDKEPVEEPVEEPIIGIYGSNDARNKTRYATCACCGETHNALSFYKLWGSEGICGRCHNRGV